MLDNAHAGDTDKKQTSNGAVFIGRNMTMKKALLVSGLGVIGVWAATAVFAATSPVAPQAKARP